MCRRYKIEATKTVKYKLLLINSHAYCAFRRLVDCTVH